MKLLELYIFCGYPMQVKFQGLSMWFLSPASNSSLVRSGEMVRGIPTTTGHEFSTKSDCVCCLDTTWTQWGGTSLDGAQEASTKETHQSHKYIFAGLYRWLAPEWEFKINFSVYWLGSCSPTIFNIFLGMAIQWEVRFETLKWFMMDTFYSVIFERKPWDKQVRLSLSFYRWGNWSTEKLSNLLEVTL